MKKTDKELKEIHNHHNTCKEQMQELWNAFESKGGKVMWKGRVDDSKLLNAFIQYDIKAMDACVKEYALFLESMLQTQDILT